MTVETLTDRVRDGVIEGLLEGRYQPGGTIPAEREMAAETGTSRVTVRRAYAGLQAAGILERTRGRGTRIADTPRGNPEPITHVALVTAIRDPFALAFIQALEAALARAGVLLVLKLTEEDPASERDALADLVRKGIRNLVVWPCGKGYAADLVARIRVLGTNVVFFDRLLPGPTVDFVGLDNRHAVRTLLEHAAAGGCSRFVFVSHAGLGADSDRLREEAVAQWCAQQAVTCRVVRVPWRGDAAGALRRNRRRWFPSPLAARRAVVCVNDDTALQVRAVLGPGERIYGIDGLDEAVAAGVVTYRQPFPAMARWAYRLLDGQRGLVHPWRMRRIALKGTLRLPQSRDGNPPCDRGADRN
jgi:DNA-binding LacI/PurR family transcriptional regulator